MEKPETISVATRMRVRTQDVVGIDEGVVKRVFISLKKEW